MLFEAHGDTRSRRTGNQKIYQENALVGWSSRDYVRFRPPRQDDFLCRNHPCAVKLNDQIRLANIWKMGISNNAKPVPRHRVSHRRSPSRGLGFLGCDQPSRRRRVCLCRHERHLDLGRLLAGLEETFHRPLKLDG